jgi:hypothetical protein
LCVFTLCKSEQTVFDDLHRVKTHKKLQLHYALQHTTPWTRSEVTHPNNHGNKPHSTPFYNRTNSTQLDIITLKMDKLPPSPIKLTPPAPKADYSQRTITHVPLFNLTVPSVRDSLRSSINNGVATTS